MNSLNQFSFFLDTRIEFGTGKINNLHKYIQELNGDKVLIITDKVLVKIGVINPIIDILEDNKIPFEIFDEVEPDPKCALVDKAGEFCKEKKCNLIIAFGGGSSMDTSKGASVVAVNEGSCYDYLDGRGDMKKTIKNSPIPIIAVPTTSGTGSEVSQYAVITHNNVKDSITSSSIYPRISVIDANFMKKLPSTVTAYTGLDALGHAIEGYTSKIENAFTDLFALEAIRLIFKNLPTAVNSGDLESRNNMALAALLGGISMSHCGATLPHAMGCPLSGHLKVPHGLAVGVLQIPMMEYNKKSLKNKFKNILNYINPDTINIEAGKCTEILIDKVDKLMKDIKVNEFIEVDNFNEQTLNNMIDDTMIHGCTALNTTEMTKEAVKNIYSTIIK
ncbi:iron-containing alcohol dehydrogenase [Haloimpatiens sp. FM7330]|uniref:iron-containing alcohol dehydrogenase n=1 Tax=Haloimpatiens sp. FM7330 TaxID=3298610 RepID=UPI0036317E6B